MAGSEPQPRSRRSWRDVTVVYTVAACLVIAAAGWFLLRELTALLRPLFLAGFLAYLILPLYLRLRRQVPVWLAILVMAGGSLGVLYLGAVLVYGSVVELNRDLPDLIRRGQEIAQQVSSYVRANAPPWLRLPSDNFTAAEAQGVSRLQAAATALVNLAGEVLGEAVVVGFYLLFMLLEAGRLFNRVRHGFSGERAEQILAVVRNINEAMGSYIRIKFKASLLLAVPATVVLWLFGVKFALLWGILTFAGNFIPYLGSLFSCTLPILLAFLQFDLGWQPIGVAVLLVGLHASSAYLIEPTMTGRAVDLSPLMILIALSFWGLCWGVIGMLLAVPLTVMMKIILENVPFTRPVARLLGGNDRG